MKCRILYLRYTAACHDENMVSNERGAAVWWLPFETARCQEPWPQHGLAEEQTRHVLWENAEGYLLCRACLGGPGTLPWSKNHCSRFPVPLV